MTFRVISICSFLIVMGGIGLHALLFPFSRSGRWRLSDIIRVKVHAFTLFFLEQKLSWLGRIKKLILLLALLSFLILFLTGFGPLLLGFRLHGILLMIHATFAPVFIGCVSLLAIGWAQGMTFRMNSAVVQNVFFWILIFLTLPVTLSIILSMFPFFGTEGQVFLFTLHRWSTLLFVCAAIIFLYILVRLQIIKENAKETFK